MTGIASNKIKDYNISELVEIAKNMNITVAETIGINKAARITTIKPSGTTSCVLGTSSGIHAWHNDYYIRRIRIMKNDALYTYLSIYHPELIEDDKLRSHDTAVISIPQKAPKDSILRNESALELLERVKKFNLEWVKAGHRKGANTNNVSATISIDSNRYYKNPFNELIIPISCTKEEAEKSKFSGNEWKIVGEWMWENKDTFNGLSVLPYDGGTYIQAPFEDCTKEKYEELMSKLKDIDLTKVIEIDDNTDLAQEAACAGGQCSI